MSERYEFSGVIEQGLPTTAVCALTNMRISNGELRIRANESCVKVHPLLSTQKQWLVRQGLTQVCDAQCIRRVEDLQSLLPQILNRRDVSTEQKAHLRRIIRLMGGTLVK